MIESSRNIVGLSVQRLFGLYDYDFGTYAGDRTIEPSLLILYGENGSGKTTLLRLIFHLLSKEQNRGHRSQLGTVPLTHFRVRLGDGTEVGISRTPEAVNGTYQFFVSLPTDQIQSCVVVVDQNGTASPGPDAASQAQWTATMKALSALDVALYYLPDNRRPEFE